MGPSGRFTHIYVILNCLGQILFLGRAPCTKETLPDFHEQCRFTRRSRVFRGLMGCQRTPGDRGVTAWYQSIGIRIPRALRGFGLRP